MPIAVSRALGILALGFALAVAFLLIAAAQPARGPLSATARQIGTTQPPLPAPTKPKAFTGSPIDGQGI